MAERRGRPTGPTGPVVRRALQLLDAFSPERSAMTLSELARHADLPLSTVHRMLRELVAGGALERGEDGAYRIGLRIWELGSLAPRGLGLRERALPLAVEALSRFSPACARTAQR